MGLLDRTLEQILQLYLWLRFLLTQVKQSKNIRFDNILKQYIYIYVYIYI